MTQLSTFNTTKWPVVIIATPRSGSTEFAFQLWKKFNSVSYPEEFKNATTTESFDHLPNTISCFIEPNKNEKDYEQLMQKVSAGDTNYIVKFMASSVGNDELLDRILGTDCFKIKLDRSSLEDQIISLYIATVAGRWDQHTADADDFTVPINVQEAHKCANIMKRQRTQLQSLAINFDADFIYEELDFAAPVDCFKNKQPTNIEAIRSLIKRFA